MRDDIFAMFYYPQTELYADNDTWILDPELYPEDIFGELPERAQRKMKNQSRKRAELALINSTPKTPA